MHRAFFALLLLCLAPDASAQSDTKAPRVTIVVLGKGPDLVRNEIATALDSAVRSAGVPPSVSLAGVDTIIRKLQAWYNEAGDDSLMMADRRALARFIRTDALIEIAVPDDPRAVASISVLCVGTGNQRTVVERLEASSRRELIQRLVPHLRAVMVDLGGQLAAAPSASRSC